jgi:hypothetical protein
MYYTTCTIQLRQQQLGNKLLLLPHKIQDLLLLLEGFYLAV